MKALSAQHANDEVFSPVDGWWHNETVAEQNNMSERREEFQRLAVPALDMLYRQAMKYTNNPEDAQDLVQDTFERGFKAFDSFKPGTNIEAWLTTILRNAYFNQYQKAKRRPRRANDSTGEYDDWDIYEASGHASEGLRSAEEEYLDAYAPEEIMHALNDLSPERRQVFIDAAIDGKSYQQVADEQGIKIGTVMSRLNRARTQLKNELEQYAQAKGYGSAGAATISSGSTKGRARSSNAASKSSERLQHKLPSERNSRRVVGDNEITTSNKSGSALRVPGVAARGTASADRHIRS